jgi:peptidoglycan-associated lipoprotein
LEGIPLLVGGFIMTIIRTLLPVAFALAAVACADNKAATKPPQAPTTTATGVPATPSAAPAPAASAAGPGIVTQNLHVSDEIARLCNLPQTQVAPSFEFDSAAIGEQDRTVLAALAKCLSDGALKGRDLELTGRADARGEEEYNMTLGESRADSVRRYMHDLGVQQERLRATSRGELDATGADEAGWARDRRVDIDLIN